MPGSVAARRSHALVLGGSIAGLCAAQALAGFFEHVTIVDRDLLPTDGSNRKAVPQGTQLHALLARGARDMETLFPGLLDDLKAHGVPVAADFSTLHVDVGGHVQCRDTRWEHPMYLASRPFLESRLRAHVAANVSMRPQTEVSGLLGSAGRVSGAAVTCGGRFDEIAADLLVDATGRGGRCVTWLGELGLPGPVEEYLDVDIVYSAGTVRMPVPPGRDQVFVSTATPRRPWGLGVLRQENERWIVNAYGYAGHHPGGDEASLMASAASCAPRHWREALEAAQWTSPVVTMRYPRTMRRRYDRLPTAPAGLLVVGDALCSFNPIYGQGMTVAAMEGMALRRCLSAHSHEGLAGKFYAATRADLDTVWRLGAGGDLRIPSVRGPRPVWLGPLGRYVEAVQAAAAYDRQVTRTFWRVSALLDPPIRLFGPRVLAGAARHWLRRPVRAAAGTSKSDLTPAST